jgi:hypothetical protein
VTALNPVIGYELGAEIAKKAYVEGRGVKDVAAEMTSGFQCAGCAEWNETIVDPSSGREQTYVEDCQVCCKPNVLHVAWGRSGEEYVIRAELE